MKSFQFEAEGLDSGQRLVAEAPSAKSGAKASKKTNAEVPGGDSSLAASPAHCHITADLVAKQRVCRKVVKMCHWVCRAGEEFRQTKFTLMTLAETIS